ncbi:MAG: phosphatase PAP2 family protein [Oceanicaulis sp.]
MSDSRFADARRRFAGLSIELKTVAAFGLILAGAGLFAWLTDEVLEGDTQAFDRMIFLALRTAGDPENPVGPGWLEYAVADLTALGGYAVLTLMVALASLYLILLGRTSKVIVILGSILSGTSLVSVFKGAFDRARPDIVEHLTHATSSSFPSGHATAAALTYLTLGLMIASAQHRRRAKIFVIWSAVLIAALVGVSRVYLGVHWPTDVLAGWAFGAAWAILWWLGARMLIERRSPAGAVREDCDDAASGAADRAPAARG